MLDGEFGDRIRLSGELSVVQDEDEDGDDVGSTNVGQRGFSNSAAEGDIQYEQEQVRWVA